jgi:hypothetical protein
MHGSLRPAMFYGRAKRAQIRRISKIQGAYFRDTGSHPPKQCIGTPARGQNGDGNQGTSRDNGDNSGTLKFQNFVPEWNLNVVRKIKNRLSGGFLMYCLAEWTGLEPATPGVTGRYSNQLNYHSPLKRREFCHRLGAGATIP